MSPATRSSERSCRQSGSASERASSGCSFADVIRVIRVLLQRRIPRSASCRRPCAACARAGCSPGWWSPSTAGSTPVSAPAWVSRRPRQRQLEAQVLPQRPRPWPAPRSPSSRPSPDSSACHLRPDPQWQGSLRPGRGWLLSGIGTSVPYRRSRVIRVIRGPRAVQSRHVVERIRLILRLPVQICRSAQRV